MKIKVQVLEKNKRRTLYFNNGVGLIDGTKIKANSAKNKH